MKQEWQIRLEKEFEELGDRIEKLKEFLSDLTNTEKMTTDDWNILCCQRDTMIAYHGILDYRLIKLGYYKEIEKEIEGD